MKKTMAMCLLLIISVNSFSDEVNVEDVKTEITKTNSEITKAQEVKSELMVLDDKLEELKKLKNEINQKSASLAGGAGLGEFGFGIGFGTLILNGSGDITSAISDNGVVRITGNEKNKLGLWLTSSWVNDYWPSEFVNFGPFFGVQLGGNNDLVNSFAVGLDLSFKKLKPQLPLDFQLGWAWTKVQSLASGYSEGNPLPTGSNQVILKKETEQGLVIIVSYNF